MKKIHTTKVPSNGTNARALRQQAGYTIAEISKLLDMAPAAYHALEIKPIRKTSINPYIKLAKFHGVGLDYLLGYETEPTFNKALVGYHIIKQLDKLKNLDFSEDGEEKTPKIERPKTAILHEIIKPEELTIKDYPFNLLDELFGKSVTTLDAKIVPTVVDDLELLFKEYLNEREEFVIKARFVRNVKLSDLGEVMGVTKERARQIEGKALRKLKWNFIANRFIYNIDEDIENKKFELEVLKRQIQDYNKEMKERFPKDRKEISTIDLDFTTKTKTFLITQELKTLDRLLKAILSKNILKLKGIGPGIYFEILEKLKELKYITYDESITTPAKASKTVRLIRRPNIIINK